MKINQRSNLLVSIIFCLFIILYSLFFIHSVKAITPTPEASSSSTIQDKIKSLQESIASKASILKQEISKKLQNKVYVGYIKVKSDNTLTIATKNGSKIITVNKFTEYLGKSTLEDYIAALGDVDENEILTARKIVLLGKIDTVERTISRGLITSQSIKNITLKNQDNSSVTFNFDKNSLIFINGEAVLAKELKTSFEAIVVSVKNSKDSTLYARTIYVLPQTARTDEVESTKSAVTSIPKASPSAAVKK